jgi:hypothetical protein
MGIFVAVRKHLGAESFANDKIILIDVGCGSRPRTAAMFCHMTRWQCYAVDPNLKKDVQYNEFRNLTLRRCKAEEMPIIQSDYPIIVVGVHSHATMKATFDMVWSPDSWFFMMSCCVPQHTWKEPIDSYKDHAIPSEKNEIRVWHFKEDL